MSDEVEDASSYEDADIKHSDQEPEGNREPDPPRYCDRCEKLPDSPGEAVVYCEDCATELDGALIQASSEGMITLALPEPTKPAVWVKVPPAVLGLAKITPEGLARVYHEWSERYRAESGALQKERTSKAIETVKDGLDTREIPESPESERPDWAAPKQAQKPQPKPWLDKNDYLP